MNSNDANKGLTQGDDAERASAPHARDLSSRAWKRCAHLLRDQRGAITFVEIVIIIAVIAAIIIVGFRTFATSTETALENAATAVDNLGTDIANMPVGAGP